MKDFFRKNKFIIFLFSLAFIVRLIYILIIDTPIISDFKVMYDASLELLNGTHNYRDSSYFLLWGYQTGHVFYQFLLLSIFNSVTFLEIINCFVTSLTVVFIYLICSKYSSGFSSKFISILYLFFPFPLFLNSLLSNQQLPLLLILISVYLFINMDYDRFIIRSFLIGIILGISNILRSESIVIIFSIFLFSLFLIKKVSFKKLFISFGIIVIFYLSIFKGTSYLFKFSGISRNGLNNMNPYWKFVLGFNYDTNGVYSNDDAIIYSGDHVLAKKETINRIQKIDKIPVLFLKKTKILWFNSDLSWSIGHISESSFYKISNIINQCFIIIFILLSLLSLKSLFKFNKVYLLCFIILFVYGGVYLLIEVMPRYAYNLQAFMAILSSFGLDNLKRNR